VKTFTLTLNLLQSSYVGWNDGEFGAAGIDPKRPYGNSDVLGDIVEILYPEIWADWSSSEQDDLEEFVTRKGITFKSLDNIHNELRTALQIVLKTQSFQTGAYRRSSDYSVDWEFCHSHRKIPRR
jgi:hypothetical protein